MSPDCVKVFLLNDSPEHQLVLEGIAGVLNSFANHPLKTILLTGGGLSSPPSANREEKTFREGDVLIFFTCDESDTFNESLVRTYCERAIERQLIIYPIMPIRQREQRRSPWRRQLIEHCLPIRMDYTWPHDMLAAQTSAVLLNRLQLSQPKGNFYAQANNASEPESAPAYLLSLANEAGPASPATSQAPQRALQALQARLYQTAISSLELAGRDFPTSPAIPYWIARIHITLNSKAEVARALLEASRAIRLTEIEAAPPGFRRAAKLLACKAAYLLGDENSALTYLREASSGEMRAEDWVEIARCHAEMLHPHRTIAALEEAFRLCAQTYLNSRTEPCFAFIKTQLEDLDTELRERATTYTQNLLLAENIVTHCHTGAIDLETRLDLPRQDGSCFTTDDPLDHIVAEGIASEDRQHTLLRQWAKSLLAEAEHHRNIKETLSRLQEKKPELPPESPLDRFLRPILPGLNQRWERLKEAAQNQVEQRAKLMAEDADLNLTLKTRVKQFTFAVHTYEKATLASPAYALTAQSTQRGEGELIAVSPTNDGGPIASALLPTILEPYATADETACPPNMLCRLIKEPHGQALIAHRTSVYF